MPRDLRVAIVCPGLGIAARGFERIAQETFDGLRDTAGLDLHLVRGRGPGNRHQLVAPTISREARLARAAARWRGRQDFWLEQLVFSATVQPHLVRLRPDVVMLGEWTLTRALGLWRRMTRQRFRILLYNGAGAEPPFPRGADHIQQLTPDRYERAIKLGLPPEIQTLLPHALPIQRDFEAPSAAERHELRRRLSLPAHPRLLLSVGALNRWHKRMDYVVSEVATLSPRPHLVMVGARDEETPDVLEHARSLLGTGGFTARTVTEGEMPGYYRAADCFVLASGYEPFGLAMVEALAQGLPVIAQETPRSRYMLGSEGSMGDFTRPGALAELIRAALTERSPPGAAEARHRRAHEMFSWDVLRPRYVEMLLGVAESA